MTAARERLSISSDALAMRERRAIIDAQRPTWTFKNKNTGQKVSTHPHVFFKQLNCTDRDVAHLMMGKPLKSGWVFNLKWFMTDDELFRRAKKAAS